MRDSLKIYISELETTTAVKQKIESELVIATQIQMSMLPKVSLGRDKDNRYDLATILKPARQVGGDLYDFMMIDDRRLLLMIGDVAGKGVPAALMVSRTITLFRMIAKNTQITSAHQILEALNSELSINNDECIFVTVFCAILDLETGLMTYASGGHDAPVLMRDGKATLIELETGMPLGIDEDADFPEYQWQLQKRDQLLLYTDGITEAMNEQEELFTDERLLDCLTKHFPASVCLTLHQVEFFHQQHIQSAEQSDDLTLVAIQYQPQGRFSGDTQPMQWQIKINNQLTDLDRVQAELGELLQRERLSVEKISDAQLILEEVLVNIISYAYPDQVDQPIEIQVTVDRSQIEMVFRDSGIPFNPLTDQEMPNLDDRDDEERELGGLGIYLVKELAKHIDYQFVNGQNVLTIVCDA
jgi:sigma-B regulation protein RsbU (phosphoserine phosphatase)